MYDEDYNSENEDFEEGEETTRPEYKSSFVIVAIDTHPSMFKRDDNGNLPFRNCLESCRRIFESLILAPDKRRLNPCAVLLKSDNPKLVDFDADIVNSIKLLKSKLKLTDDELEDEYRSKRDCDLAEFLLECKKAFHDIKAAFNRRTLVFITNDDNPVKDTQSKFAAINEVKSFEASQISFQVIPTDVAFNFKLFYNEMLYVLDQESYAEREKEICTDVDGLEQKLSTVMLQKFNKTRVNFYPFKNDFTRYVNCFDMKLHRTSRLLNKTVSGDGKEIQRKQEQCLDLPTYIVKSEAPAAQEAVFDSMEKESLYDASFPRGYTLIYIGKTLLEPMYCYKKPHVLQVDPTEETTFFKKFWDYCVENNRVLISVVKFRKLSSITYCQMSPILFGDTPTFLCKKIPYGNHFVPAPPEEFPKVENDEQKNKLVRNMIDKLTIEFHPDMIPDQKYRKKFQYVKSKLLDQPYDDALELFSKSSLDERVKDEIEQIISAFEIKTEVDSSAKRKRPAKPSAGSRKKKN